MLTLPISSSSLLSGILFGMLFAWFLAAAAMTFRAGMKGTRTIIVAPEKVQAVPVKEAPPDQVISSAVARAPAVEETPKPPTEGSAPVPLSRGAIRRPGD
ncbi:MAG TPA: hypothetical protein VH599_06415 [Ktedonobacterales bacterium]|jgi:hypothetical protein